MALWRRRKRPAKGPKLQPDPRRADDRSSTRQVIQLTGEWAHRLATAIERTEQLAPVLFPDERPGDRDA